MQRASHRRLFDLAVLHCLIWWHWRLFELLEYFFWNFSLFTTCDNERVSNLPLFSPLCSVYTPGTHFEA